MGQPSTRSMTGYVILADDRLTLTANLMPEKSLNSRQQVTEKHLQWKESVKWRKVRMNVEELKGTDIKNKYIGTCNEITIVERNGVENWREFKTRKKVRSHKHLYKAMFVDWIQMLVMRAGCMHWRLTHVLKDTFMEWFIMQHFQGFNFAKLGSSTQPHKLVKGRTPTSLGAELAPYVCVRIDMRG